MKLPVPLPLEMWLLDMVGFCEVLQQMPRSVTVEPPEEVTLPPDIAVLEAILLGAAVKTDGNCEEEEPLASLTQRTEWPVYLFLAVRSEYA